MDMDITFIAIVIGVILVSMMIHEVMHGLTAYMLGDDTAKLEGRLTLNPIKHIDPFLTIILPVLLAISGGPIFGGAKPVPFNPARLKYDEWGVALVAIAGPLTNLIIAFVAYGLAVVFGLVSVGSFDTSSLVGSILAIVVQVNLGFFIFNMIPMPPLDGSRVMYALAPEFVRRGMEMIERFGILVVFAIVLLASPILFSFMSSAIRFFLDVFSIIFGA